MTVPRTLHSAAAYAPADCWINDGDVRALLDWTAEGGCPHVAIADIPKPKAQSPKPKAQSPRPKAQGPKPKAQSPRPKAQSPRPKVQSPKSKAQSPKPFPAADADRQ